MLPYLVNRSSQRRQRLFAAGCCRRIAHLLSEDRCRRLLEEAVRFGAFDESDPLGPDFLLASLALAEQLADGKIDSKQAGIAAEDAGRLETVKGFYYACYD